MTLVELERIEAALPYRPFACCEGEGTHSKDCTFAEDCPLEADELRFAWEARDRLAPLFAWARDVLKGAKP